MPRGYNKLTALKVARLSKPGRYSDGGNLYLQVSKGKGKSWLFRVERQTVTRWMGLGSARSVSLEQARELAKDARWCVLNGIDPLEQRRDNVQLQRREQLSSPDFETCAKAYIEKHAPDWKNAKHRQQWGNTLATYTYPIIGVMKVRNIDTAMVLQVLEPIWNIKPETASRVRGRLERILAWAKVQGYREGDNPACWHGHLQELLPRREAVKATKHHSALPHREVAKFWSDVHARPSVAALAMKFTILSCCRTNEVLGARWEEFDWNDRVWIIPAQRMKRKRPHRVPLVPAMQVILELQRGLSDTWVFPGDRAGRPISNMSMLMLLRRMNRQDITVHGFRSCFRDWVAELTGHAHEVAEMALSHKVGTKVERAYLRTDMFEHRRQILDDWAAYCVPFPEKGCLKVMLDCEFTDMSAQARLVSLALVAVSGEVLYVELPGNYEVCQCSPFVQARVLPQLKPEQWGIEWEAAQSEVARFLKGFAQPLVICTDAPEWDWPFFCRLAVTGRRWPANVIARPWGLSRPEMTLDEVQHHALVDAQALLARWQQQEHGGAPLHPALSDTVTCETKSEMP